MVVNVAVNDRFLVGIGSFSHRVHSHISIQVKTLSLVKNCRNTHKNVPPENNSTHPVVQARPSSPPKRARPSRWTMDQVNTAPAGAAKLNMARCVRILRFEKPCFSNTEVRPNAAGALCSMMAKKMTSDSEVDGAVEDAPKAMPSAHEWITSPMVVADERGGFETWGGRGVSGSGGGEPGVNAFRLIEDELCGPRCRFEREIWSD